LPHQVLPAKTFTVINAPKARIWNTLTNPKAVKQFGTDGNSFSGGWRPHPGADETVNVSYDASGTRIK